MTVRALPSRRWPNVSFTGAEGNAARDLSMLRAHYERCNGCKGRWFSVQCAIEALDAFVAPRFVTTVLLIGAVVGLGSLVL